MTDIRVVMHSLGKLEGQVSRLISDTDKFGEKIGALSSSVDRYKTAFIVAMSCLGIFLPILAGLLWWSVGQRISSLLLSPPPAISSPQQTPVAPQIAPKKQTP